MSSDTKAKKTCTTRHYERPRRTTGDHAGAGRRFVTGPCLRNECGLCGLLSSTFLAPQRVVTNALLAPSRNIPTSKPSTTAQATFMDTHSLICVGQADAPALDADNGCAAWDADPVTTTTLVILLLTRPTRSYLQVSVLRVWCHRALTRR